MDLSFLSEEQRMFADQIIEKCIVSREYFIRHILEVEHIEDWQLEAIQALDRGEAKLSIRSGHGTGKAQRNSAEVPTPFGRRIWGGLGVGDYLFGSNGRPTKILEVHPQGVKPLYSVTFSDGAVVEACAEHLWTVRGRNERRVARRELGDPALGEWITIDTAEILRRGVLRKNGVAEAAQWEIPSYSPVEFHGNASVKLPVDPYVLGVWLGDGCTNTGSITNGDSDIWSRLKDHYTLGADTCPLDTARTHTLVGLVADLRSAGVVGNKHVPAQYLTASIEQRVSLLNGLMDSDGNVAGATNACAEFNSTRLCLVESVIELARSLGMYAKLCKVKDAWYRDESGEKVPCKDLHRCRITTSRGGIFWLPRKENRMNYAIESRYETRWITSIEYSHEEEAMCVTVDAPDSLYLCNEYVVTHNTCFSSWLALHFLLFRDDVKIIVTSPSFKQMTDGLMPEVQKWIQRCPSWLSRQVEITSDRMTRVPNTKSNFISFRTARKENPEALAGVHATNVLLIVDEASGVDEIIYETGQGILSTTGAIAVLIGNPTRPYGFFYKTQTTLSDLWWCRAISCLDSTRVDAAYIESQKRTYGVDSREYRVRVLGEFPDSGADSVIPRAFVQSALDRDVVSLAGLGKKASGIVWGLDPGRGGDPTGFVERSANVVTEALELKYDNLMLTSGWVKSRWDATVPRLRPDHIYVDSIGLGAGVADRLLELGLPVIHVNVSESAAMSDRFVRLRGELWYTARAWFEKKDVRIESGILLHNQLIEELSTVEQHFASNGKVDIESKKVMKARGVPSPNLADALVMTFAHQGAVGIGSYDAGGWGSFDTSTYKPPHVC